MYDAFTYQHNTRRDSNHRTAENTVHKLDPHTAERTPAIVRVMQTSPNTIWPPHGANAR